MVGFIEVERALGGLGLSVEVEDGATISNPFSSGSCDPLVSHPFGP